MGAGSCEDGYHCIVGALLRKPVPHAMPSVPLSLAWLPYSMIHTHQYAISSFMPLLPQRHKHAHGVLTNLRVPSGFHVVTHMLTC